MDEIENAGRIMFVLLTKIVIVLKINEDKMDFMSGDVLSLGSSEQSLTHTHAHEMKQQSHIIDFKRMK